MNTLNIDELFDLDRYGKNYNEIFLVQIISKSGKSDHMVAIADYLLFDARLEMALYYNKKSFEWVAGNSGLEDIGHVLRIIMKK